MKWHRVQALLIRHLYLYRRNIARVMDLVYWPVVELLLWGFLSIYLDNLDLSGVNVLSILLGGIIFWDIFSQAQRAVSITFLEEIWERNLLNIFVTPLTVLEFLVSMFLVGLTRIAVVGLIMGFLAFLFYQFNVLMFGLAVIPFMLNLLLFGWVIGIFTTALLLRYGTNIQAFAFGVMLLIQPFSAVFYPVSALPETIQWISYIFPSTHVFEGMRSVIAGNAFPTQELTWAFGLNAAYSALVLWYFYAMFSHVKRKGLLMKLN